MKRIVSACLEQTQRFEFSRDLDTYLRTMKRKRIRCEIVEQSRDEQGCIVLKTKREYNGYPINDYFTPNL